MSSERSAGKSPEEMEMLFATLGIRNFRSVDKKDMTYLGWTLISFSVVLAAVFFYTAFLSKLFPVSGNDFIDAIKFDSYFCFFVPLLILPTYLIVYLNWLAISFFSHN